MQNAAHFFAKMAFFVLSFLENDAYLRINDYFMTNLFTSIRLYL